MRMQVRSLASLSRLRIRHFDELWRRPEAPAPIQPLAQELPYAMGVALKKDQKKNKKKNWTFQYWAWRQSTLEALSKDLVRDSNASCNDWEHS